MCSRLSARLLSGSNPTRQPAPFAESPRRPRCSGIQSPLSFGGFGALTRHLRRLTGAIGEALEVDALDRGSLGWINAYNPGGWAGFSHNCSESWGMEQTAAQGGLSRMLRSSGAQCRFRGHLVAQGKCVSSSALRASFDTAEG